MILQGDNLENLKKLEDNSIDSVVTDPPYGLSFMNKKWDYDVPSVEFWKEVYRVLKPGGHVLSFGGTRTYHRMVVNIEDAGFEIRDQIMWLYGSGFPKSHNIGKAVDKLQGNEREVDETKTELYKRESEYVFSGDDKTRKEYKITKGTSQFEGWGTALKPANEPICVARKPLSEKSVAENVLKWGTGGINVDGCRVGYTSEADKESAKPGSLNATGENSMFGLKSGNEQNNEGRFPANIILECLCDEVIKGEKGEPFNYKGKEYNNKDTSMFNGDKPEAPSNYNDKGDIHTNPMCPCRLLDEQSGVSKSSKYIAKNTGYVSGSFTDDNKRGFGYDVDGGFTDKGGASRFFYKAKVSKKERNMGLDGFETKITPNSLGALGRKSLEDRLEDKSNPIISKNNHPTIKPITLMSYLCRLITPEGGVVLDPFMGSGSTGIAAKLEGFDFIGMEMDEDYVKIASARIENFEKYREFLNKK
jgi:DNA modification methylase